MMYQIYCLRSTMKSKTNHDIKFITSVIDLYDKIGDVNNAVNIIAIGAVIKFFIHDC